MTEVVPMWECEQLQFFSAWVASDTRPEVTYGVTLSATNTMCECPSYTFGTGTDEHGWCKHLRRADQGRCHWSQQVDGGAPEMVDGKEVCPRCGSPAVRVMVAV